MNEFYTEMEEMLVEMLDEFGFDVPMIRTDPITGNETPYTLRGAFVTPKSNKIENPDLDQVDQRMVVTNKVKPLETDHIAIDSELDYIVMRVVRIGPTDQTLGYRIEMRNAANG